MRAGAEVYREVAERCSAYDTVSYTHLTLPTKA